MFCSNCGSQIDDGAKFCGACGAAVATSKTEAFSAPTPETTSNPALTDPQADMTNGGFPMAEGQDAMLAAQHLGQKGADAFAHMVSPAKGSITVEVTDNGVVLPGITLPIDGIVAIIPWSYSPRIGLKDLIIIVAGIALLFVNLPVGVLLLIAEAIYFAIRMVRSPKGISLNLASGETIRIVSSSAASAQQGYAVLSPAIMNRKKASFTFPNSLVRIPYKILSPA